MYVCNQYFSSSQDELHANIHAVHPLQMPQPPPPPILLLTPMFPPPMLPEIN